MPRVSEAEVQAELDVIEGLVAQHAEGISRTALGEAFSESQGRRIAKRTLLRRLERLISEDRVRTEGEGPSVVYRPGPALVLEALRAEGGYVPISREAARVRALVRRPVMERKPVG